MASKTPDKIIVEFIKKHHVLTLSTVSENKSWCSNCFYAYLEDENALVFTSDKDTRHIKEALKNPEVSGSIVLETRIIGKIQGIQFSGRLTEPKDDLRSKCHKRYLRRFPYAALMDTTMWMVSLSYIKMTDNRLGFGKKLYWP